ncbi:hypothetical protein [Leucobacter iarius]|uniref:Uncharacterized protein n=1 Tax=Leucobacter iarius TaxID=333963 RepID=A0ABP4XY46_9MICO
MRTPDRRGRGDRTEPSGFPGDLPAEAVERIGILAARSVSVDRELRRTLAPRLAATHAIARRARADAAAGARRTAQGRGAPPERPGRGTRILWGALCIALMVALIALAATFGPIKHSSTTRPDVPWAIAVVAGIVALSTAALLHLLPSPRRGYPLYVAEVCAWLSAGMLVLVILYRAFGLHWRETEFSPEQIRLWLLCATTVAPLTVLLASRWRRRRARLSPEERLRGSQRPRPPGADAFVAALRTIVEAAGGIPQAVRDDWRARLDREARRAAGTGTGGAPAGAGAGGILAALAAADGLDPVEVLARIHADGGRDVERVAAALR